MALKVIVASDTGSNDVPWINEYLETEGEEGDSCTVVSVKKTPKGLLVIGSKFKGFLFSKSAIAGFLTEALDAWVSNSTINYPLFMIAESGGKVNLAIDEELEPSIWVCDKKGISWEQKLKKTRVSGLNTPKSNPLLPTPPPTTSSGKKAKQTGTPQENEMMPYRAL